MSGPKVLLFDLGGVLVEFVGVAEMQRILGAGTIDQLKQRWATSPALARFEVGRCSVDDFAADFVEEWRLKLEPAEFVDQFSSWVRPPAPATLDMLSGLRGRYRLACLSNTNAVHWAQMLD